MKLRGKVHKIDRIMARSGRGTDAIDEEKRVYTLSVRLPDPTLDRTYNYGYGNMNFVLHGQQMEDFVDLGGSVDVYVMRAGEVKDVPDEVLHSMQSEIYRLEGELKLMTEKYGQTQDSKNDAEKRSQESAARLTEAMREMIRLTAQNEALRELRGVPDEGPALLGKPEEE